MKAPTRLALFGAGLVVAFGAAFGLARVAVPDDAAQAWTHRAETSTHDRDHAGEGHEQPAAVEAPAGVSLSADGYALSPVRAPDRPGTRGELSFRILDTDGRPVTTFTRVHDQDLHLIVVRSDGARFRHVHPVLDERSGTWSLPWTWREPGDYRVYADFTPAGDDATGVTLTRTVRVAGDYTPAAATPTTTDEVAGYTVSLSGDLTAGAASEVTVTVERDGRPVTTLQPYLGAYGHLVALREGDLAYLHVHPEGAEPAAGATGGPDVGFTAEVPTAGRYLLYLDFRVAGTVHTAAFVVDARR